MLPLIDLRQSPERLYDAVRRPAADNPAALAAVREILASVRERGDLALCELTERFDGVRLSPTALRASDEELQMAWERLDPDLQAALRKAAERIRAYHDHQPPRHFTTDDGVLVAEREIPVERAGIYVPGGRAEYPSTVLMTVIPAQAAQVEEIALCVPPGPDGLLPVTTAAAAWLLGVGEVYKLGGAQAIAAMAYGTPSVPRVDVVVGPGNLYVALAKSEVSREVGVESLAGPSECVVVADPGAPPSIVALDLMAQAEHGPGGFCLLVTWSDELASAAVRETERLLAQSPRAADIRATFEQGARVVLVADADAAIDVANAAAAEHLQLMVADPVPLIDKVRNAGAVFCGYDTPVTLGDYVAGPSHVLPTGGTARFASALHAEDFVKRVHVVTATPDGLNDVGPVAATIADAEGLAAHAETVRARLRRRASF